MHHNLIRSTIILLLENIFPKVSQYMGSLLITIINNSGVNTRINYGQLFLFIVYKVRMGARWFSIHVILSKNISVVKVCNTAYLG